MPGRPSPRAILAVVGFSVFIAADDLTVVSTMLRPIINDLDLVLPDGLDDAAWVVNAYLIAFVAVMPIAGRVSDVVGRRRAFIAAWLVFLVGTVWIPLAGSLPMLLVGRVLTAIGGGAMVPIALAVVGDVYPERQRARALGTLGAIETLGWVWGPLYGALLVRYLTWQWQFWLNVPLAIGGIVAVWWALADHERPAPDARVDWLGAALITGALVSLNLALLGGVEVQSVQGLDELTGEGVDLRFLYPVAVVLGGLFVWRQARADQPLLDLELFRGRLVRIALLVNLVVGAALVIAMVDVPLFVNAVEIDVDRSAVVAGWILSALTAAMAVMSYVGGRATERWWSGPPIAIGLVAVTAAYLVMGLTWEAGSAYGPMAVQLAVLGAGIGLTIAPTTSAVVDGAAPDRRGAAAAVVMVIRLLGLSIGLSALTAWGLSRFNALRGDVQLPAITDPTFGDEVERVTAELTAQSIAETYLATAAVVGVGLVVALVMLPRSRTHPPPASSAASVAVGTTAAPDPREEGAMELDETNDGSTGASAASLPAPELSEHAPPDTQRERRSWLTWAVGGLAAALVAAFVLIAILFAQLSSTRDDLQRVEAGAALFSSQVTGIVNQLGELSPSISAGLDEAITGLETFGTSTLTFDVAIDEEVNIGTEVVIDRTVSVPIQTSLPIDEEFDTRIVIDGPFGIDVPLNVTVPVEIDVPIDLTVDIPINETVPVDADVPVKLDVPISVDVSETELATLTDSLAAGLESFREVLAGLGG